MSYAVRHEKELTVFALNCTSVIFTLFSVMTEGIFDSGAGVAVSGAVLGCSRGLVDSVCITTVVVTSVVPSTAVLATVINDVI